MFCAMPRVSSTPGFAHFAFARLFAFRREVAALWRAFFHPATPWYLKAAMLLVVAYVVMPLDLAPDIIPVLGWLDDATLVALAVGLIYRWLPAEVTAKPVAATVRRR
jgi:uncharacterized membrane protein YkvA (DUF1232 family)